MSEFAETLVIVATMGSVVVAIILMLWLMWTPHHTPGDSPKQKGK